MSTTSSTDAGPPTPHGLDDLAPELKQYLCKHLPICDLKSLALTSSTWYAICEPRLWSHVDIYPVRYRTSLARDAAEATLRLGLLSTLEARPNRVKHLRRLTMGSKVIEPEATDRLLRLVAPTLDTLRLRHMSCGLGRDNGQPCADVSWGTISLAGLGFDRLRELSWPLSDDRIFELRTVLGSMPALERLTICGLGSWVRTAHPQRPAEEYQDEAHARQAGAIKSPELRFFSSDVAGEDLSVKLCREILEGAPHLVELELGCEVVEEPDGDDQDGLVDGGEEDRLGLVAAVASMKELKALYVWFQCLAWEDAWMNAKAEDDRPFESITWLMIPRTWDEDLVPSLPNLTTLIAIYLNTDDPLTCASRPTDTHTGRLDDWFVEQLDQAPLLTEIAVYDRDERMIMRGSEWKDVGCFGVIIRAYVGPYGTFYHYRCHLSSDAEKDYTHSPVDREDWVTGSGLDPWGGQDGWVDLTLYRDRELSYEVLWDVYELEDMEVEFEEGGRDMKLSDAAWEVLEGWRNGANEADL